MPAPQDLTNREFGLLTVERLATPEEHGDPIGRRMWRCRCACEAIVYHATSALNSGRYGACPACGGPQPQRKWRCTCVVCTRHFEGRGKICSAACREARRRATEAGLPEAGGLPPPVRACVECGTPFRADRNFDTCSKECRLKKKRRQQREFWRVRCGRDPDLPKKMNQRRRERAKRDPAFAEIMRRYDAQKHARHRARMRADPEYADRHRARANARYAIHRATIQARRRARVEAMSPAELEAWLERARRYCRRWRRRYLADLALDPIQFQRYRDIQREYRHQRRRRQLMLEAARLETLIGDRGDGRKD